MTTPASIEEARIVLEAFGVASTATLGRLGSGLINDTFAVEHGGRRLVLQRVHPVFAPENHHNIVAVTEHLHARGLTTPRLLLTKAGKPWHTRAERPWRLMTRLPGVTFDAVQSATQARAAAKALGGFHAALTDLAHEFVGVRTGVHDTPKHLAALRSALAEHPQHRLIDEVAPLATAVLEAAESLPELDGLSPRVMHGDPKLNNIVFEGPQAHACEQAVGLIDLDTVAPMALHLELGDAWRSWCNPKGEDETVARFEIDVFEASVRGYAASGVEVTSDEREALVHGVELISVELAARFLADALRESYFGWNAQRYESAGAHNLVRAKGQWSLHRAVVALRAERARILETELRAR